MNTQRFYNANQKGVLTLDQIRDRAPSVFAEEKHSSRAERYRYIPTVSVLEALIKNGFNPVYAAESKARNDDRFGFTKHVIRFRREGEFLQVGDLLPEVVLLNSHDGTSSYQLSAGIYRLACLNGLVVSESQIDTVRVRHSGNVIDNVIEGTFRIIEETPKVLENIEQFKSIQLSPAERQVFGNAAKTLRWDAADYEVKTDDIIRPVRRADTGSDLWSTFNVIQEKIIKGGVPATNKETKVTRSSREIKAVGENIKLNKALWTLAEGLAALKTA